MLHIKSQITDYEHWSGGHTALHCAANQETRHIDLATVIILHTQVNRKHHILQLGHPNLYINTVFTNSLQLLRHTYNKGISI